MSIQPPNLPFPTADPNARPGPKELNDLHTYDDVDASLYAHHHTLGTKPYQAAPGNHGHAALTALAAGLDGSWTTYTPTLTNMSVGSGGGALNLGWYKKIGSKTVLYRTALQLGTGAYVNSWAAVGPPPLSLASYQTLMGIAVYYDAAPVANYQSGAHLGNTGYLTYSTGAQGMINSTVPHVWAVGDGIHTRGFIELA